MILFQKVLNTLFLDIKKTNKMNKQMILGPKQNTFEFLLRSLNKSLAGEAVQRDSLIQRL